MDESEQLDPDLLQAELAAQHIETGKALIASGKALVKAGESLQRLQELSAQVRLLGAQPPDGSLKQIEISIIVSTVASAYRVHPSDITESGSRRRDVVAARQMCMYVIRDMFGLSYPAIAQHFRSPKRDFDTSRPYDHTTVVWGIQQVQSKMGSDAQYRIDALRLIQRIRVRLDAAASLPNT